MVAGLAAAGLGVATAEAAFALDAAELEDSFFSSLALASEAAGAGGDCALSFGLVSASGFALEDSSFGLEGAAAGGPVDVAAGGEAASGFFSEGDLVAGAAAAVEDADPGAGAPGGSGDGGVTVTCGT